MITITTIRGEVMRFVKEFRIECLRTSARVHSAFRTVKTPVHAAYFCACWWFEPGFISAVALCLLGLLLIGWVINEEL